MANRYLLGFDVGSSSVKASLVNADTGVCAAAAFFPEKEAPIMAVKAGWAEQDPQMWWDNAKLSLKKIMAETGATGEDIIAVGISYQMHGLVCVDKNLKALRPAIIWCDSRAVPYGEKAFNDLGADQCLTHLLNSPGNFTAAKLAWVKENEPNTYDQIYKIMLPGDYIAMRLSGQANTTVSGLSEGMFWDFKNNQVADFLMKYYGFDSSLIADIVPTFGIQGEVSAEAAAELGLKAGTPISYRGGDQPNNALSLNVLNPGEIAATAGTSGVVYGVLGEVNYDKQSRVNTFAHVNHSVDQTRLGVLLCINGLNFNKHSKAHLVRAAQEGIVFSFCYGMEIMQQMGMDIRKIHAGKANMFLSPLFRNTLAGVSGATIELYDTDGSVGAAKGAGIGAGIYKDSNEAFATLEKLQVIEPDIAKKAEYQAAYAAWKATLEKNLK